MEKSNAASLELAVRYWRLFVNRLAYTVQSEKPGKNGKHYYYKPKGGRCLSRETVLRHLNGQITIGIFPINPETQRSKWVAIDADYGNAVEDLLKLQWELLRDGVEAALEKSRRGGHLWIFAAESLLARDCRVYIYNLATRLKVPVKGSAGLAEGIEVFPRQDELGRTEFGNALRGPLGIHRAVRQRFWFYGADYAIEAQLEYLERLTCELTIFGLGTHSATGEEFTDNENALTAAEAQAFKRTCCCFGLGRYLYHFTGVWVDLDERKRPNPGGATTRDWNRSSWNTAIAGSRLVACSYS